MDFLHLPVELLHVILLHLTHEEILSFTEISSACYRICDNAYFLARKTSHSLCLPKETVSFIPVYRKYYRKLNKKLIQTLAPQDFGYDWEEENEKVVQDVIDSGANLHFHYRGMTPLQIAIENEESKMVNMLLTAGSDANARGPFGLNALLMCLIYFDFDSNLTTIKCHKDKKMFEILTMLLEDGADLPEHDSSIITFAISRLFKDERGREILSCVPSNEKNPRFYSKLRQLLRD